MKPLDILDALSDLPEEYVSFEVQHTAPKAPSEPAQTSQTVERGISMKTQTIQTTSPRRSSILANKAAIAAAIALCIGLNAAMIFGIAALKQTPGTQLAGTQMPSSKPPMQEITTTEETAPVPLDLSVPNLVGMEWETAKQNCKGYYLAKHYVDADGTLPETIISQSLTPGSEHPKSNLLSCEVAKAPETQPLTMTISIPSNLPYSYDTFFFIVKDSGNDILGCSDAFSITDSKEVRFITDCPVSDTPVTVWVNDVDTDGCYPIGEYVLHQPPAPGSPEQKGYTPYSIHSEHIEEGFTMAMAERVSDRY